LCRTEKEEIVTVSNDLNDHLNQKDQNSFWCTWNSKFVENISSLQSLVGCIDATVADNKFADLFASVCMPNNDTH